MNQVLELIVKECREKGRAMILTQTYEEAFDELSHLDWHKVPSWVRELQRMSGNNPIEEAKKWPDCMGLESWKSQDYMTTFFKTKENERH